MRLLVVHKEVFTYVLGLSPFRTMSKKPLSCL
jgi:hypothetical protein